MKKILKKDIKVGDYLQGFSPLLTKGELQKDEWAITYFIVEGISKYRGLKEFQTTLWIDFNRDEKFLRLYKSNLGDTGLSKGPFFQLTEKEFNDKLGKYIIIGFLGEGEKHD
jgi:hypothetical protein